MEREGMTTRKNLMTIATRERLEKELEVAHQELKESQLAIGEAAGPESDWHDNAAFDHAQMGFDIDSVRVRTLQNKLQNVEIISPREETDDVGIGNEVVVKFREINEKETFTILCLHDSGTRKGWISYLTPLAQSILGKKKGEVGIFRVGDRDQKVEILDILPGNFKDERDT